MSIKIKGLDKPKSCSECKFCFVMLNDFGGRINEKDSYHKCFLTEKILCRYDNRKTLENIIYGDCPITQLEDRNALTD